VAAAQQLQRVAAKHHAVVGLQRQLGERMHGLPEVAEAEWREPEVGAQLNQVLAPRLLTLGVLRPARWVDAQLACDPVQHRRWHVAVDGEALARVAQQAYLHGEAQSVRIAAALPDQRQVVVIEGVLADQFVLGVGQRHQAVALGGG
jgi:hypothetical protein